MVVAVLAALAAGCTFALGAVLQQDAARQAPPNVALSWRLIVDLAHRRRWVLGIAMDVGSFALQALALGFGPIALVQPLLVTGVLFSIPVSVRWRGKRLGWREWLGTVAVAGGLSMFLVAASPRAGTDQPSFGNWVLVMVGVGGLMALGVALGRAARGAARASLYGVAAGAAFGLLAALTKASTGLLQDGAAAFFGAWQPYTMAVVAALGMIVQQSAFQAGPLPASIPVMDATEPTVAVLIGVFVFAEAVGTSALALAGEAVGICAILAGIVALDRSPVVLELFDQDLAGRTGHPAAARTAVSSPNGGAPVTDGAQ